jgi:hypothetical protein
MKDTTTQNKTEAKINEKLIWILNNPNKLERN